MATRRKPEEMSRPRRPPATTPDGRENQLIELATDLAERQLYEGTASSQVISHYLKLGSSRERLEQERLVLENELTKEKTNNMASAAKMEELYAAALGAMSAYKGEVPDDRHDD
jgi:hypothetical protein